MVKFTFLGANDSIQEQDSGNTSLLVAGEQGRVVIDVSCNLWAVVEADVDAVILTHEHIDHVYALGSLLHQLWLTGRKRPLRVYTPEGMHPLVNGLIDLFALRQKKGMFPIHLVWEDVITLGTMTITPFRTQHTAISIGMVVEEGNSKLVYTCDTIPLQSVLPVMQGAQVLIHEASGVVANEQILVQKGHSSGYDAGTLAKALAVQQLYLCHLPQGRAAKEQVLRDAKAVFGATYLPIILEQVIV